MTPRADEAAATLADIENIVAKVGQSRICRKAALVIVLWGVVDLVRDALIALWPQGIGPRWFLVGVAGGIVLLRVRAWPAGRFLLLIVVAFALLYAFAWIWADLIGRFGPREQMAFRPTPFLFGHAPAGLRFDAVFTAIGLGLTARVVAGYVWGGDAFCLSQAAVPGVGFIACGLRMRRA